MKDNKLYILQNNKYRISMNEAEKEIYQLMMDYVQNPDSLNRPKIERFEYSKGGESYDGIYTRSVLKHIFCKRYLGKKCTVKAKYNYIYGFDKNDNLVYRKFYYGNREQEEISIINNNCIVIYQFGLTNNLSNKIPDLNTITKVTIEKGVVRKFVSLYIGNGFYDYNQYSFSNEFYHYENDKLICIKKSIYSPLLSTYASNYLNSIARTNSENKISLEKSLTTSEILDKIGYNGIS
jgi:hypothetical protein